MEDKRKIFKFHDGMKNRYVDPIHVVRTLQRELKEDMQSILDNSNIEITEDMDEKTKASVIDLKMRALDSFEAAGRKAFGVQPLDQDGAGLTVEELMDLFQQFMSWSEDIKKNTVTIPKFTSLMAAPSGPQYQRRSGMGSGKIESEPVDSNLYSWPRQSG